MKRGDGEQTERSRRGGGEEAERRRRGGGEEAERRRRGGGEETERRRRGDINTFILFFTGEVGEVQGAVKGITTNPTYIDVTMPPASQYSHPLPGSPLFSPLLFSSLVFSSLSFLSFVLIIHPLVLLLIFC